MNCELPGQPMTHQATKRNGEEARDSMIRVLPAAGGGSAGSNLAGDAMPDRPISLCVRYFRPDLPGRYSSATQHRWKQPETPAARLRWSKPVAQVIPEQVTAGNEALDLAPGPQHHLLNAVGAVVVQGFVQ